MPKLECTLEQLKSGDYNWEEAFDIIKPVPAIFSGVSADPVAIEDVEEIVASVEGENDGPDWVMVGRLKDGRWFAVAAGCDYTGWDCQAGGNSCVAGSLAVIIRLGLTDDERQRLELEIQ